MAITREPKIGSKIEVIWDISVIVYLINKEWFETSEIKCPNINDDTSYELNTNNHLITMVNFIDSDKVFEDMFKKLEENEKEQL